MTSKITAQVAVAIWLEQSSPPKVSPPKWPSRNTLSFSTSDTRRPSGRRKVVCQFTCEAKDRVFIVRGRSNSKLANKITKQQRARFWTFEHYVNWICENTEPPIWTTCIEQFHESLCIINKIKSTPLSVRAYAKSLNEIMNQRHGKNLSKNLLRAQTNKKAYDNATDVVNFKRQATQKKVSHEQKKRRTDNTDDELSKETIGEPSFLFDESHEDGIVESIDESSLGKEVTLPASKDSKKKVDQGDWKSISAKFTSYQNKIPKTRRIITLGYWGIIDLTLESLHGCTEFSQGEIDVITQDFADHVQWSPKPTPKYLQEYFKSNCDPSKIERIEDYETFENLHMNIRFAICHMPSTKGAKTEESLKFTTIYPLFNAVLDSSLVNDIWGEVQAIGSKEARNEDANPFVKARIGRKVDMKGVLTRTSNKFEALYGEVAGGLSSIGISLASRKKKFFDKVKLAVLMRDSLNQVLKEWKYLCDDQRKELIVYGWTLAGLDLSLYAMDWAGDGIYRFGRIDYCSFPSNKESCILFESVFCLLKELERKLSETETIVQKLHSENIRGKCRKTNIQNSPILNLKRTPK
ncbi:12399_t:CDS:10 [Funneliformis caledonium]|uniref:12399_t:CDS:1 n=1 Tax=Funneliformis caledonium TaxID=1117310 RepID=A0A9N8VQS3_9GLOM|nr:12399_t:CDS:10 [Funneliformis caledonium]